MTARLPDEARRLQRQALLVGALGNMVSLTPAVAAVFGLFLIPLSETFGWPRAAISGVLMLISILPALATPFAGRLADRIGPRPVLVGGNLVFSLALGLLALTSQSLLQFYLTFALVALSSAFASTPLLAKVVSDRFEQNRGAALGFTAGFGNGFGSTIIPIIAAAVLVHAGWRLAYAAVAAVVLVVGLPTFLWLMRGAAASTAAAEHQGEGLSLRDASRSWAFWLLVGALAAGAGSLTAIFSHMVPILAERGIGVGLATLVLSVFAMGAAAWQMACGAILDRTPSPKVIVPMYLAAAAGVALLEWGTGTPLLIAAGLLLAVGLGAQFSALPYLLGRYFGLRHFGAIMGSAYSAVFVFQGLVPVLLDHAFDLHWTYSGALAVLSACLVVGGLLLLFLPPYRYGRETAPKIAIHA
ncbi:MFS transporter [Phenylobacterium sp. VNQ135]|uniref:MFS transporter n=1 Tax=Phenylobacterium sp. VNQ135 TaxID=3400922 RepID=UPI003C0E9652